jgi:hypothetical protein
VGSFLLGGIIVRLTFINQLQAIEKQTVLTIDTLQEELKDLSFILEKMEDRNISDEDILKAALSLRQTTSSRKIQDALDSFIDVNKFIDEFLEEFAEEK